MNEKKRIIIHNAVYTAICFGIDVKKLVEKELHDSKMNMDKQSILMMNREIINVVRLLSEE